MICVTFCMLRKDFVGFWESFPSLSITNRLNNLLNPSVFSSAFPNHFVSRTKPISDPKINIPRILENALL